GPRCPIRSRTAIPSAVSSKVLPAQKTALDLTHTDRLYHCDSEAFLTMKKEFIDPVCGMNVTPETAAAKIEHNGETIYFCSAGCRDKFAAQVNAPAPVGITRKRSTEND